MRTKERRLAREFLADRINHRLNPDLVRLEQAFPLLRDLLAEVQDALLDLRVLVVELLAFDLAGGNSQG